MARFFAEILIGGRSTKEFVVSGDFLFVLKVSIDSTFYVNYFLYLGEETFLLSGLELICAYYLILACKS